MRGTSEISGLRSIKSMHSSSKRSIPRVQSSAYLDLYTLRKEKDRLEKDIYILDKKKGESQKKLDDVNKQMDKLLKAKPERKEGVSQEVKKPKEKDWKMMTLKY